MGQRDLGRKQKGNFAYWGYVYRYEIKIFPFLTQCKTYKYNKFSWFYEPIIVAFLKTKILEDKISVSK